MLKLHAAVSRLAEAVLPASIPPVAAIPAGFDSHAAPASRARLAGAILINATSGEAWVCPPAEDNLGQNSKKLSISATGAYADAKDLSELQVQALNVSHYIPAVFGGGGADGAPVISHEVQGLLVTLQPVATQGGFDSVNVVFAGRAPVVKPLSALSTMFKGLQPLPWRGEASHPPPFPVVPGIPTEVAATAAVPTLLELVGPAPAGVIRSASLGTIGIVLDSLTTASSFISGLVEEPDMQRALLVGLAADPSGGAVAAGPAGPELSAVQRIVVDVSLAFHQLLETATPPAYRSTAEAVAELTRVGLPPSPSEVGLLFRRALSLLPAVAPAAAPPPAGAATTGPDMVAAAIAAAMGVGPDPITAEATSRLAPAAAALTAAGQYDAALAGVVAALTSSGWIGGGPPEPLR